MIIISTLGGKSCQTTWNGLDFKFGNVLVGILSCSHYFTLNCRAGTENFDLC